MNELEIFLNEHVEELINGRRFRFKENIYRINKTTMEILAYSVEDEILGLGKVMGTKVARVNEQHIIELI